MYRYTFHTYKEHYACFDCRKAYKWPQWLSATERRDPSPVEPPPESLTCPQCAGSMTRMGLDFCAPPKRAVVRWRVLAELRQAGVTFISCGCSGPGWRPSQPSKVGPFLRERASRVSPGARLLARIGSGRIPV